MKQLIIYDLLNKIAEDIAEELEQHQVDPDIQELAESFEQEQVDTRPPAIEEILNKFLTKHAKAGKLPSLEEAQTVTLLNNVLKSWN